MSQIGTQATRPEMLLYSVVSANHGPAPPVAGAGCCSPYVDNTYRAYGERVVHVVKSGESDPSLQRTRGARMIYMQTLFHVKVVAPYL